MPRRRGRSPGAWAFLRRGVVALGVLLAAVACTASPAAGPPPPGVPVVVALGDSVPAGTACGCDPFPELYARQHHAVAENMAVPGYTAADVLGQVAGLHGTLAGADEVLLMVGANDLAGAFDDGVPYAPAAATVRTDVDLTVGEIESVHRMPVLVLGYWNVVLDGAVARRQYGADGVKRSEDATTAANDALRAAAASAGATYVDTLAAFHGPDGSIDPTTLLAADGDHPDAAGHAAIAALLPPIATPQR